MKKTWKERLYDVSCSSFAEKHIPQLLIGLSLVCMIAWLPVCMISAIFLFDCQLLVTILCILAVVLLIGGMGVGDLFDVVKTYNKETFLRNKIRNILLADQSLVTYISILSLMIVVNFVAAIVFKDNDRLFRVTTLGASIPVGFLALGISKLISNNFKKKIAHIEMDKK